MKAYTTPEVRMQLEGAQDILANAEKIILTAESGKAEIDRVGPSDELTVEGDTIIVRYTQEETVSLGVGDIRFEATVKLADGTVVKSTTVSVKMGVAVREELA